MGTELCISFYLANHTIHIFRDAIRAIGTPGYIRFWLESNGKAMLLEPYDRKTFTSFRVPENLYSENGCMRISSKRFCDLLAARLCWRADCSYKIFGQLFEKQRILVFDFSSAVVISKGFSSADEYT